MTLPAAIRLLTPQGLFRRVEDGWSPRKEIHLDREARWTRERQQALSPVKLPSHEILSHALVYPARRFANLEEMVPIPLGTCVIYEWLGPIDGYPELAICLPYLPISSFAKDWTTDAVLKSDAERIVGKENEHVTLLVTYAGPAFQE